MEIISQCICISSLDILQFCQLHLNKAGKKTIENYIQFKFNFPEIVLSLFSSLTIFCYSPECAISRCTTRFSHPSLLWILYYNLLHSTTSTVTTMWMVCKFLRRFLTSFKFQFLTNYLLNISVLPSGTSKWLCPEEDSLSVSTKNQVRLLVPPLHLMAPTYCQSLCIFNFSLFLSSHNICHQVSLIFTPQ